MEKTNTNVCFITNDVETTSLWNHCLSDKTGEKVLQEDDKEEFIGYDFLETEVQLVKYRKVKS